VRGGEKRHRGSISTFVSIHAPFISSPRVWYVSGVWWLGWWRELGLITWQIWMETQDTFLKTQPGQPTELLHNHLREKGTWLHCISWPCRAVSCVCGARPFCRLVCTLFGKTLSFRPAQICHLITDFLRIPRVQKERVLKFVETTYIIKICSVGLLICESIRTLGKCYCEKYPWFFKDRSYILSKIVVGNPTLPWAYKNQLHIDLATNFAWLLYRTAVRVLPVFH